MGLGDFFSRYEVTNSVGFMPLFPDDGENDYYDKTVTQAVAYNSGNIDTSLITATLLGVNSKVSFSGLDRLGGSANSSIIVETVDEASALLATQALDPTATSIDNIGFGGGVTFFGFFDLVYLDNTGRFGPAFLCGSEYYWLIEGKYRYAHTTKGTTSQGMSSWDIEYMAEDGSMSSVISGNMPTSTRFSIIDYNSTDASPCLAPSGLKMVAILNSSLVIEESKKQDVMAVRYKVGGVINKGKYLKALNARMGIPNREVKQDCEDPELTPEEKATCLESKTLKEGLEDPDMVMQILTYAVKYEKPYMELIDELLSEGGYTVHIEGIDGGEGHRIDYIPTSMSGANNDRATGFTCYVDGHPVFLNPDKDQIKEGAVTAAARYIIPVEYMQLKMDLRTKYDTIENGLCWMVYSSKVTKRKWYQTGLFKILVWVVAIAFAATGNPMMLIGLVGSTIIGGIFGSKAAMIVGIIMAVWTLGTSLLSSAAVFTLNTMSLVLNLAGQISNLYFSNELDAIMQEVREGNETAKETAKAIQEMGKEMLYMPFSDVADAIDYTMYELPYDIFNSVFDYDQYTKLSLLKNYNKG